MCYPSNDKYKHSYSNISQLKFCYAHGFYVSADFNFSHFEKLKSTFSHHSISPNELCTNGIKVVGGQ